MSNSLEIVTDRDSVVLRQSTLEDAAAYYYAVDASRDHLSQFGDPTAGNYPDLKSVEDSLLNPVNPDKLRFGIWDADTFVGSINIKPDEDGAQIGYWLDERWTGHGYATVALRAVSRYAKTHVGQPHAWVKQDNHKSAAVMDRAGFTIVREQDDKNIFEWSGPVFFPLLHGLEKTVMLGNYKLLDGSDRPTPVRTDNIQLAAVDDRLPDAFAGIHQLGSYVGPRGDEPIYSFKYHKLDATGELETGERVIIVRGVGYGIHPGHSGQQPSWYVVGPQIGTAQHATGQLDILTWSAVLPAKHFSLACITDGPLGMPVLANSLQK